jgi:hypothetical protein
MLYQRAAFQVKGQNAQHRSNAGATRRSFGGNSPAYNDRRFCED